MNKKKNKDSDFGEMVYSTNSSFAFAGLADLLETSAPNLQLLEVHIEKKGRNGKAAILIKGFLGKDEDLQTLAKKLKTGMGVGGSAKDGEIIIQGEKRDQAITLLNQWGYKTKRVGG